MVSFVGKLSVVVVLLEGKMAAAFKFTMIAAVVVALGRRRGGGATRERGCFCSCCSVAKERKPGQRAANPLPAWDMLT